MRTSIVILAAALGLADAAVNGLSPFAALSRRQGEAFDPDEGSGFGESCADAFGEGSVECVPRSGSTAPLCIEPGIGQTCCDGKWGCPAGSFCLVQDLCCPDGLDPESCAAENGVTLPPDFGTSSTAAPDDTATAEPTGSAIPTTTASESDATTTAEPTDDESDDTPTETATTTSAKATVTAGAHHQKAGVAAAVLGLAAAMAL